MNEEDTRIVPLQPLEDKEESTEPIKPIVERKKAPRPKTEKQKAHFEKMRQAKKKKSLVKKAKTTLLPTLTSKITGLIESGVHTEEDILKALLPQKDTQQETPADTDARMSRNEVAPHEEPTYHKTAEMSFLDIYNSLSSSSPITPPSQLQSDLRLF